VSGGKNSEMGASRMWVAYGIREMSGMANHAHDHD
jgi:hypothetical protein